MQQPKEDPFAPPVIPSGEIPVSVHGREDGPLAFAHRVTFENYRFNTIYSKLFSPWPTLLMAGYASLCLPIVSRFPYGFPSTPQMTGITAMYLAGGQIMASGDPGCGSLLVTIAALTHITCFGPRALRSQRRVPLALAGIAVTNLAIYTPAALWNVVDVCAGRKPFLALGKEKGVR